MLFSKKEKILTIELVVSGLPFWQGSHGGGRYHPFVQITNATGMVVGRSKVMLDCAVNAHFPAMKLSWKDLIAEAAADASATVPSPPPPTNKRGSMDSASTARCSTWCGESGRDMPRCSPEEAVFTQPLLVTVYDYKGDGNHLVVGQVQVTLQEMVDRANQLGALSSNVTLQQVCQKEPSYTLWSKPSSPPSPRGRRASFSCDSHAVRDSFAGNLYIKQIKSTRGKADPLSQEYFYVPTADLARLPNCINYVLTPPGLHATTTTDCWACWSEQDLSHTAASSFRSCADESRQEDQPDDSPQDCCHAGSADTTCYSPRTKSLLRQSQAKMQQVQDMRTNRQDGDGDDNHVPAISHEDAYIEGRTDALIALCQARLAEMRFYRGLLDEYRQGQQEESTTTSSNDDYSVNEAKHDTQVAEGILTPTIF